MSQLSSECLAWSLAGTVVLGMAALYARALRRPELPFRAYANRSSIRKAHRAPEGDLLATLSWG